MLNLDDVLKISIDGQVVYIKEKDICIPTRENTSDYNQNEFCEKLEKNKFIILEV